MFSIGDFAKHGRVSIRMLRHYDAIGLLRPAHVDPAGTAPRGAPGQHHEGASAGYPAVRPQGDARRAGPVPRAVSDPTGTIPPRSGREACQSA